jgi:transketolase
MSVVAPCDPSEVTETVRAVVRQTGPVYLRLGKSGEPLLTAQAPDPFIFGKVRQIKSGTDVAILSYGPIAKMAFDLAARLEASNRSVAVYSVHTVKPLDIEGVALILKRFPVVAVLEEHVERGGLGAQVKQIAWDRQASCRLATFALKNEFLHVYSSLEDMRYAHGLSVDQIYPVLSRA